MERRQILAALAGVGLGGKAFDLLAQRTPDVIFVPTAFETVNAMLKLAEVTSNDIVYDLGCGDGRFVVTASQQFGARGVGVDIDPSASKRHVHSPSAPAPIARCVSSKAICLKPTSAKPPWSRCIC